MKFTACGSPATVAKRLRKIKVRGPWAKREARCIASLLAGLTEPEFAEARSVRATYFIDPELKSNALDRIEVLA